MYTERALLLSTCFFLVQCAGEVSFRNDGGMDGDTDGATDSSGDDGCARITCPPDTECAGGECVPSNLCLDVSCPNEGERCVNGQCVSGERDGDNDGFRARDDCNDDDATVHPGATELCNIVDDDCDPATADGADDCPGFCCGAIHQCQQCCEPSQCGTGPWRCEDFHCSCGHDVCGEQCCPDDAPHCVSGACRAGHEGDPCQSPDDCHPSAPHCYHNSCQDGSEGDPCQSTDDCHPSAPICYENSCQDGSEGDSCFPMGGTGCNHAVAPHCPLGACTDGTSGDTCRTDSECRSGNCVCHNDGCTINSCA